MVNFEDMQKLIEEIKALEGKRVDLEGEELATVVAEIEGKTAAFDAMERELVLEAKAEKVLEAKSKAEGKLSAQAKDHNKEAAERNDLALQWMAGKSMSGEEYKAVNGDKDNMIITDGFMSDFLLGKTILTTDVGGSASGGGALVPDTLIRQLQRVANRQPTLMEYCQIFNGVTGAIDVPVQVTKATASSTSEGAAFGGTEPTYDQVQITTSRVSGMVKVSERSLENSIVDVQANVFMDLRNSIMNQISSAVVTKVLASSAATVARATALEVVYTDLVNLIFGITQPERPEGIFCVSDGAEKYLVGQVDTDGRPIYAASTGSVSYNTLAGYPYVADGSNTVALGTEGDAIFGNFNGVGIALESGIKVARGYDADDFSKGLVTLRAHVYAGEEVLIADKFSLLTDAV